MKKTKATRGFRTLKRKIKAKKKVVKRKISKPPNYGVKKITSGHYLTFLTSKGRPTKKKNIRSDRKYIIEVRSKKTKRVIGYMNSKSLTPIKVKKVRKRKSFKTKLKPKIQKSFVLKFKTSTPLIDQIRNTKRGQFVIDSILSFIRKRGSAYVGGTLDSPSFQSQIIAAKNFTRSSSREDIEGHLVIEMSVNTIHQIGFRASPKKFAKSPNRKHVRSLTLTVDILDF